jgi:hypothetical protein
MKAARAFLVVAACVVGFWPQHASHAAGETILLVWPVQGHNGDTFYLSGHGYLPNTRLSFVIACPSFFAPGAAQDGNVQLWNGPTTNQNGDFSGYPVMGFMLHVLTSSPCEVRANYAELNQVFVCTICGLYNIVPPHTPLQARARFIQGHVRATPQRVRAGIDEKFHIDAWGGATAQVTVRFPHQKPRKIGPIHLDWRGQGDRSVPVDSSAAQQPGVATVGVSFSLGDKRGSAATSFTVVR